MHKKGISEEVAKKKTRRTVKHQRAVVGASWEAIRAKRNQKPEVRAAARASALRDGKEKKKAEETKKKAEKTEKAKVTCQLHYHPLQNYRECHRTRSFEPD